MSKSDMDRPGGPYGIDLNLVLVGIAFGLMAFVTLALVDPPYSLVLAGIVLATFAIQVVRRMQYGHNQ